MNTNLPTQEIQDSAAGTKLFFDTYGDQPLEFNANEVDACIAFFTKNGFEQDAAIVTATALLKQSKIENVPIYRILDTLKNIEGIKLSALVAEILNNNRTSSSTLGYREPVTPSNISRNIHA
jgi:hypothetical protein